MQQGSKERDTVGLEWVEATMTRLSLGKVGVVLEH